MNKKITFYFTEHYNQSEPQNGFNEQDFIIVDDDYSFMDYLTDHNVIDGVNCDDIETDEDYIIGYLDGAEVWRYWIYDEEQTDDEPTE